MVYITKVYLGVGLHGHPIRYFSFEVKKKIEYSQRRGVNHWKKYTFQKKKKQGRQNVTELRPCSFGNERDTGE